VENTYPIRNGTPSNPLISGGIAAQFLSKPAVRLRSRSSCCPLAVIAELASEATGSVVCERIPLGYARKGGAMRIQKISRLDEFTIFRPGLSKRCPQRHPLIAHPLFGRGHAFRKPTFAHGSNLPHHGLLTSLRFAIVAYSPIIRLYSLYESCGAGKTAGLAKSWSFDHYCDSADRCHPHRQMVSEVFERQRFRCRYRNGPGSHVCGQDEYPYQTSFSGSMQAFPRRQFTTHMRQDQSRIVRHEVKDERLKRPL